MRGLNGGFILLLSGMVMLYRGVMPAHGRSSGKRAFFGMLSPGGQRVALVILGLLATLFGLMIFYQAFTA